MADYGVQISQRGIPLNRAADYQKVLDTKWPYLDIFVEQECVVSKSDWPSASADWSILLMKHNLGKLPAFTYREIGTSYIISNSLMEIVATRSAIYLTGTWLLGDPTTPLNMKIFVRVFDIDMSEEYEYKGDHISPQPKQSQAQYGAKIINPRNSNARMDSKEMSDFSLNTGAKALGVHKTGIQVINAYASYNQGTVTAIDTATDIFTVTGTGMEWIQTIGQACAYYPADYVTYPSPLTLTNYFIIPITPTTIKLASTYQNALDGIAINITTTGALNGHLNAADNPSNPSNIITHNVGYPPTYFMSKITRGSVSSGYYHFAGMEDVIAPINAEPVVITADTTKLYLYGAQALWSGTMAYIIAKDPSEVAS